MTRKVSFEQAKRMYIHRYTMEHVPQWAKGVAMNGKFYAPRYRSDREWYENTVFPGEAEWLGPREKHCHSDGQSWPLGHWLEHPFKKGA